LIIAVMAGVFALVAVGMHVNRLRGGAPRTSGGVEALVRADAAPSAIPIYIKWSEHPQKCLDVLGGYTKNGNTVQLWDCNNHPDMQFLVPAQGTGLIQWAKHPEYCLDAPGGDKVILWHCDTGNRHHMLFTMPAERKGAIRLASHLDSCLGIPMGASNGDWVVLSSCNPMDMSHMEFTFDDSVGLPPAQPLVEKPLEGIQMVAATRKGMISWTQHPEKCFDVVGGYTNNGNAVQIWDCHNNPDMQFMVPPSGTGLIKWAKHPELCLDSPDGKKIIMWNCEEGNKRHMEFTMPDGDAGAIRLASMPNKCLGIPPDKTKNGVWIQLWNCDAPESSMSIWSNGCTWGEWSDLSSCSEPCGGGVRSRHRQVAKKGWTWGGTTFVPQSAEECEGPSSESVTCNADQCLSPAPPRTRPEKSADSCANYGCSDITPGQSCQCHPSCKQVGSCCLDFEERCGGDGGARATPTPAPSSASQSQDTTTTMPATSTSPPPTAAPIQADAGSGEAGPRRAVQLPAGTRSGDAVGAGSDVPVTGNLGQQESVWQAWRLHPRSFTTAFIITFVLFLPLCCWLIPLILRKTKRRGLGEYKQANCQADGIAPLVSKDPRRGSEAEDDVGVQVRFPEPEDSE
jgi:hypothetical protein